MPMSWTKKVEPHRTNFAKGRECKCDHKCTNFAVMRATKVTEKVYRRENIPRPSSFELRKRAARQKPDLHVRKGLGLASLGNVAMVVGGDLSNAKGRYRWKVS